MKLHQNLYSSAAMKVRAVVHELGLACQFVEVDMPKGQHKSPDFLTMNPNGKVPVLEDDGFYLWESNAILCYLAAKKPEGGLMPADPRGMALVQQWIQWQATTLANSTNEVMMETVYAKMMGHQTDEQKLAKGLEQIRKDLGVLEASLGNKEYVCGRLTIADFSLITGLMPRAQMGFDLEAFPKVKAWAARMETRESLRKAMPPL